MPATYEPIATTTLTTSGTITFSSIPSTYTDLVLVTRLAMSGGSDLDVRLNGDTGNNYSFGTVYGTGSVTGGSHSANLSFMRLDYYGYIGEVIGQINIANFQNYSNTSIQKTVIALGTNASNGVAANVCLWRNTSAINSISILGTCSSGSTATLYGIKAA